MKGGEMWGGKKKGKKERIKNYCHTHLQTAGRQQSQRDEIQPLLPLRDTVRGNSSNST